MQKSFGIELDMDVNRESGKKITKTLRANQVELACQTAEEFTKLYYKYLDKQRDMIPRMYMDNATLVWNGNCVVGKDDIQKFWVNLPSSEHATYTLDAQPIIGPEVDDQLTFLVKIAGQVRYKWSSKLFNQTFLIMAMDDKWKIVNDCFRTLEVLQ